MRAACAQRGATLEVVVLDDGSTDGTGEILARLERELPRLRVDAGAPLPPGWAGKAWACWQLADEHARHPWVLFVDCDVRLDAGRRGARARGGAGRQSPRTSSPASRARRSGSPGEALLVPLIYLVLLVVSADGAHPKRSRMPSLSAGCGQFMLVRRARLPRSRTVTARCGGTLHDGIMLARRMKATGIRSPSSTAADIATCRMYAGFRRRLARLLAQCVRGAGLAERARRHDRAQRGLLRAALSSRLPISLVGDGLSTDGRAVGGGGGAGARDPRRAARRALRRADVDRRRHAGRRAR